MAHFVHIVESSATGVLSMLSLLANKQCKDGHIVDVIYSKKSATPLNFSEYFNSSVNLIHCEMYELLNFPHALRFCRHYINSNCVDGLFLHSSIAGFIGRLCLLLCERKPKIIIYFPHCISFMRKDIDFLKKYLFIGLEWVACLTKATYVACSKSEYTEIVKYIPFADVKTVENAVDVDSVRAKLTVGGDAGFDIVTVGEIRSQKNPHEFCEIAKRLLGINPNITIAWIGDGDPVMRSALLKAGVSVLGWKDRDDVFNIVTSSKLFLSTSRWEGHPVALIEATLLGIPILSSTAAGNIDIIRPGLNGLIYRSVDDATEKAMNLLNSRNRFARGLFSADEKDRKRFSAERYFAELSEIIGV